ncbi:MAG: histidinol-phosphatase [bacterium]
MILDYHIHPNFSIDAQGTIEEYAAQAVKLGIAEICFTPHFEIDSVRKEKDDKINFYGRIVPMRSEWIDYYFKEIEQARKKLPDLQIRSGIEVGYDPAIETDIKLFIKQFPFDFILGAIHCINHIAITDHKELDEFKTNYLEKGHTQVAKEYFEILNLAIKSGLFHSIAHFDVYKKYGLEIFGEKIIAASEPFLDSALDLTAKQNIGLEINTSGLRRNPKEIYPAPLILLKAKQAGVKIFTIGSDAHRIKDLGSGLQEGFALAQKLGLDIYRFEQGRPIALK